MTITDLKSYAERMNTKLRPTDQLRVTMTREAVIIVGAFLESRHRAVLQALYETRTKDKKRERRKQELSMITEALNAIDRAVLISPDETEKIPAD